MGIAARQQPAALVEVRARPWLKRDVESIRHGEFQTLIVLTKYAHLTLPRGNGTTKVLAERCNRALERAGALRRAAGFDVEALDARRPLDVNRPTIC